MEQQKNKLQKILSTAASELMFEEVTLLEEYLVSTLKESDLTRKAVKLSLLNKLETMKLSIIELYKESQEKTTK